MAKMVTMRPRPGGRYLNPDDVIRGVKMACARAACAYVETSSEGARMRALEWMNQPAFGEAAGSPAADSDYLALLELAEAALFVHFGDDLVSEGALLSMLLIPRQPLLIEYSSQAPIGATRALIARCAKMLGYEIVAPPDTTESAIPDAAYAPNRAASAWAAGARFVAGWTRARSGVRRAMAGNSYGTAT